MLAGGELRDAFVVPFYGDDQVAGRRKVVVHFEDQFNVGLTAHETGLAKQ